jgi:predicted MFS family arabinose efflux permease
LSAATRPDDASAHQTVSRSLTLVLAAACGLIVANIYYAQPLAGPISAAIGLPIAAAGLIVTMTQIGYGVALLLVVPAGDLVENRRLIVTTIVVGAIALLGAALSNRPLPFLTAAFGIGLGSVAVQIMVPYAAHLAPESTRGRVVGNVSGGLMLGVMLARPVASFVTEVSSWHVVFVLSAIGMAALAVVLGRTLPRRAPASNLRYAELLTSMWRLARTTPVLQWRAFYQACLFAAFSLFWTTTPLLLAGPDFRLSQAGIGLFALAGVAGAVAAPIAGRTADRGWTGPATALAMLCVALAFLLTHIAQVGSGLALALLVAAAILLDFGVQGNVVLGYRAIFALDAENRGRLHGLYMSAFFAAGAAGSALGGWAYARGGWTLASWIGFALPVAALLGYAGRRGYEPGPPGE